VGSKGFSTAPPSGWAEPTKRCLRRTRVQSWPRWQ
jgi:hypothetical protein